MKILLINPKGLTKNEFYPLGLLYLTSVLENKGYNVKLYDGGYLCSNEKVLELIKDYRPDVCGITLYTTNLNLTFKLISLIKRIFPNIKIITGGPHATALPELTLKECPQIDFLVMGEGEETFIELLEILNDRIKLPEIKGICYRENSNIKINLARPYIEQLDKIPFPSYHLVRNYSYSGDPIKTGKKIGTIITSRGCPYKCVFCNHAVFGRKYRRRTSKNVVDEIIYLKNELNIDEIYFQDDLFATQKEWLENFYNALDEKKVRVPWKCLGRIGILEKKDYEKMKKYGCYLIQFGVESGNNEILKDIKKGITKELAIKSFFDAKSSGLLTYAFFIVGHRLETYQTVKDTYNLLVSIKPDFVSFFVLVPFPGTEVYSLVEEKEKYNWERIKYWHFESNPISICSIREDKLEPIRRILENSYYSKLKFFFIFLFSKSPLPIKIYRFKVFLRRNIILLKDRIKYYYLFKKIW